MWRPFGARLLTRDAAGESVFFQELVMFELSMLSLPLSNGVVQRTFSVMNIIDAKHETKSVHVEK